MPTTKRPAALYQRGVFWLDWDRKADGSLRSPFLAIFWYDGGKRRIRSASTRETGVDEAKRKLDAFYLERTRGQSVCQACGRPIDEAAGHLVTDAIANYLLMVGDTRASADAIRARLGHVVAYIAQLRDPAVLVDAVDENWVAAFRTWAEAQPVVGMKGKTRTRSLSTVEGSVAQLQAAINHAWRRGDTRAAARFKPIPIRELNRTPQHRSDLAEVARMLRYCVAPKEKSEKLVDARIRERAALRRFILLSIATLGRPDAVLDVGTGAHRRQWNGKVAVLALNPALRRQTKKYRATVPVAWQVARHLEAAKPKGFFVGPSSVRKAWEAMAADIGLPGEGEAGMKLIRRSVAQLLRDAGTDRAWSKDWQDPARKVPSDELELFLGHRKLDSTSDLYAAFSPTYLANAKRAIEAILDELEANVPGAVYRTCTGDDDKIVPLAAAKKA